MRIQAIKAAAFGPFADETLDLSPGMNVIYGPNESGKSSWHAAIYASLCGMRRARGRANREDQDFADRHRPWNARTWRVSAVIDLDDGRTVELDQSLGRGGRSTATERHMNKQMTSDVERDGAVDVSTLLGLTRETAVATIFVRQADVLRVLADASSLQEYLERAAATSTIDTTADEALARIAAYKRERVGLLRVGSRGPLATASRNLDEARAVLDEAENRYEEYQALLERQRDAQGALGESERTLRHVLLHETERRRLEEWSEIRAAQRQLEQANLLQRQIGAGPPDGGPRRDVIANVTRALAAFEARPPVPPPLEGPTITDIEADLSALPDVPDGDLEPAEEVIAPREAWHREAQRLAAHDNNQPGPSEGDDDLQGSGATAAEIEADLSALPDVPDGDLEPAEEVVASREAWQREVQRLAAHDNTGSVHVEVDRPPVPPAELRRLADELEAPLPVVDSSLRDEVNARRAAQATPIESQQAVASKSLAADKVGPRPTLRIAIIMGVVLAILGLVLLVAGQPLPGAAAVVLGCALAGIAFTSSRRAASTMSGPSAPERTTSVANVELQRLEARLLLEEEAVAQAARRRDGAVARLDALNLSLDPAKLRQLASTDDAATFDRERRADWERRRDDLETAVRAAAQRLRATLAAHGADVADQDDLDQGFQLYVQACRQRAQQASRAARRVDLEARLRERRAADTARAAALERRADWERRRDDLETAVRAAAQRLRVALAAHGADVADQDDLDQGFQLYVQACRQRAQQASRAARRVDLEARLRERRAADTARDNDLAARATTERQLVAAAAEVECSHSPDPEQMATILRNWLVTQEGLGIERQEKAQHIARLDQLLDGRNIDELEAEIAERIASAGHPPADHTGALDDRSAEARALEDRVRAARDHAAELVGQLEVAGSHLLDVSAAIEAEARADAEVRRLEELSDDLDRATKVLVAAQRKVHADIAPVLNSTLQPWVPRITLGRYDDIRVNPATLEIEARESGGAFRPATLLSQGTTEQLFLLLRLALAQHLATTGESAPIILDDVTVQSDTQRTVGILDLLHELSVDRQVILFSQEDEVLSWADQHLVPPTDRLVRLSRRGP